MIVIEGTKSKSAELKKIISGLEKKNEALLIDSVGVNSLWFGGGINVFLTDYETIINNFQEIEEYIRYPKFKLIIFGINIPPELVEVFKEHETRTGKDFIVTVLNEGLENTRTYEV